MSQNARQWLKIRLKNTTEANHVVSIVEYWRSLKTAAPNVTKAIRLYYSLTQGDTTLLQEYFPWVGVPQKTESTPTPLKQLVAVPKTRDIHKTGEEDLDDFMGSLGI